MNTRHASLLLVTALGPLACASASTARGGSPSIYGGRTVAVETVATGSSASYAPPQADMPSAAPAGAAPVYSQSYSNGSGGASVQLREQSVRAPQPSTPAAPPAVNGAGPSSRVTVTAQASVDGDIAPSRREPSATEEAPPSMRQGLATEWGETRSSNVGYTSFTRASSQPFDTAAIYYNDASGVAAQANYRASQTPIMFAGAFHDGLRVSLRDESGRPLAGYMVNERLYVLGSGGQRYTILLENTTPVRFEAVVSVDGLDVINGRPAAMGFRGYIIPAHGQIAIDGFRQDAGHVAAFRFGTVGDSYAAQTGSARNVGVIGVALFSEYGVTLPVYDAQEVQTRETANPFPGQFAPPPARRYYQ